MQRDSAKAVGHAREHRLGEGSGELLRGVPSAWGRPQHFDRDGREPPILQEPLVGGGIVGEDQEIQFLSDLDGELLDEYHAPRVSLYLYSFESMDLLKPHVH
jgi:hypothetical protein